MSECTLCPRKCRADRSQHAGLCGCTDKIIASKAYLHKWEEPCLCGNNGAGAVFFSGCSLKCCYCQNFSISHLNKGREISVQRLADIFLELQDKGACNIDLVTPTHFTLQIIKALDMVKHRLKIPVVYNCGGYELSETIKMLDGYIEIYLPDFKYFSNEYAVKYSQAPDYFEYASSAVSEMISQTGTLSFDSNSILQRGTVIRHLVIPTLRHDSIKLVEWLAENFPHDKFLLSLMSQFTPNDFLAEKYPEINRRITKMEYNSVLNRAAELGINGFSQDKSSADSSYTPDFDFIGL